MRKEIEDIYSEESDMTFIMENTYDETDILISIECVGWYFGTPDLQADEEYKGSLKTTYKDG